MDRSLCRQCGAEYDLLFPDGTPAQFPTDYQLCPACHAAERMRLASRTQGPGTQGTAADDGTDRFPAAYSVPPSPEQLAAWEAGRAAQQARMRPGRRAELARRSAEKPTPGKQNYGNTGKAAHLTPRQAEKYGHGGG
jgi:hypothetical protein